MTHDEFLVLIEESKRYYAFFDNAYHNESHAMQVVNALSSLGCMDRGVKLAAWFHDVIYVPRAHDGINEDASAAVLANSFTKLKIGGDVVELHKAVALIKQTNVRNHLRNTELDPNSDIAYLMDADLVSLAAPYYEFAETQNKIICENHGDSSIPQSKTLTANFLEAFLVCRKFIYHTDRGRHLYEEKAKRNINNYIKEVYP